MRYFIKGISDEKLKEIIAPSSDIICVKKGKCPKKYLKLYCGFDIETSHISDDFSTMYVWQMSLDDITIIGREWYEFTDLLDLLQEHYNLTSKRKILCFEVL